LAGRVEHEASQARSAVSRLENAIKSSSEDLKQVSLMANNNDEKVFSPFVFHNWKYTAWSAWCLTMFE